MTKFHCLIAFTLQNIGQYVYCICFPVCDVINFKTDLNFLIKSFSYMTKKAKMKI